MLEGSEDKSRSLQSLSALADGELDAAATMRACSDWRGDAEARSSWHAYHLIGDVMRSEELASNAARDAGFLRVVAQRLATEPVVFAPQPAEAGSGQAPSPSRRAPGWSWLAPAAVAAGFMAVASVLVVTRGTAPVGTASDSLAQSFSGKGALLAVAPTAADAQAEAQTLVADGQLVRDARLDRYLAAHKQFGGSSALGVPSGFLRAATTQMPDR